MPQGAVSRVGQVEVSPLPVPHHQPIRLTTTRRRPSHDITGQAPHLRRILRQYETHHNRHRPHRSPDSAAPLKPLPEPVDPEQHRVRKRPRVGGMINEYRLVA
jgi:hypothetical protein